MTDNEQLKAYVKDICQPLTEACHVWASIILPSLGPGLTPKRKKPTARGVIHQWAIKIANKQKVALYTP